MDTCGPARALIEAAQNRLDAALCPTSLVDTRHWVLYWLGLRAARSDTGVAPAYEGPSHGPLEGLRSSMARPPRRLRAPGGARLSRLGLTKLRFVRPRRDVSR